MALLNLKEFLGGVFWKEKENKPNIMNMFLVGGILGSILVVSITTVLNMQTPHKSGRYNADVTMQPDNKPSSVNLSGDTGGMNQEELDQIINQRVVEALNRNPNAMNPNSYVNGYVNNPGDSLLVQSQLSELRQSIMDEMSNMKSDLRASMQDEINQKLTGNNFSSGSNNGSSSNGFIWDGYKVDNNSNVYDESTKSEITFNVGKGLNNGTFVSIVLDNMIVSSGDKCPVKATVTESVIIDNKVVVPNGAFFLGYGIANPSMRKIFITFEKLIIGNREIDIKGHMVGAKNEAGFVSQYIDYSMQLSTILSTLMLDFASIAASAYKDQNIIIGSTGMPVIYYPPSVHNAAMDALSGSIANYSAKITQNAMQRGYLVTVQPNIKGKVFLDAKIPLNLLTD